MSKRNLLLGGIAFLVFLLLSVSLYFFVLKKENPVSPFAPPGPKTTNQPIELLLYEDEAGFSFGYPQSLGVVEKEVSDPTVYSSLELASKNKENEKLVIRISDTSFKTVEKYLEKNPPEGKLVTTSEISLGGMKGKNFLYAEPDKTLVLVIDSGILYFLEGPQDNDFWDQTLKTIVSSFKLTEEKTTPSAGGGAGVIEEEEEVIE